MDSSIFNAVVERLPKMGQGGFLRSGVGSSGFLESDQDIYAWMDNAIVSRAFTDPVCGDGVCELSQLMMLIRRSVFYSEQHNV